MQAMETKNVFGISFVGQVRLTVMAFGVVVLVEIFTVNRYFISFYEKAFSRESIYG